MATSTPNLELIELQQQDLAAFAKFNETIYKLDTVVQLGVKSRVQKSPPTSAVQGDRFIVPDTGTSGAFLGQERKIAYLSPTGWLFRSPKIGFIACVEDENDYYGFKTDGEWHALNLETVSTLQVFSADVNGLVPAPESILGKYLGDDATWHDIEVSLEDLSDADIVTPSNGQLLAYHSATSKWINVTFVLPPIALEDLSDVEIDTSPPPSDGFVLTWKTADGKWIAESPPGTALRTVNKGANWASTSALVAGSANVVYVSCPVAGTITKVKMVTSGGSGSCVVDVRKKAFGAFPPASGDSITASDKPAISAGTTYVDSTLTGWTTSITAGDVLAFVLQSCSTFTQVQIVLEISQ